MIEMKQNPKYQTYLFAGFILEEYKTHNDILSSNWSQLQERDRSESL